VGDNLGSTTQPDKKRTQRSASEVLGETQALTTTERDDRDVQRGRHDVRVQVLSANLRIKAHKVHVFYRRPLIEPSLCSWLPLSARCHSLREIQYLG